MRRLPTPFAMSRRVGSQGRSPSPSPSPPTGECDHQYSTSGVDVLAALWGSVSAEGASAPSTWPHRPAPHLHGVRSDPQRRRGRWSAPARTPTHRAAGHRRQRRDRYPAANHPHRPTERSRAMSNYLTEAEEMTRRFDLDVRRNRRLTPTHPTPRRRTRMAAGLRRATSSSAPSRRGPSPAATAAPSTTPQFAARATPRDQLRDYLLAWPARPPGPGRLSRPRNATSPTGSSGGGRSTCGSCRLGRGVEAVGDRLFGAFLAAERRRRGLGTPQRPVAHRLRAPVVEDQGIRARGTPKGGWRRRVHRETTWRSGRPLGAVTTPTGSDRPSVWTVWRDQVCRCRAWSAPPPSPRGTHRPTYDMRRVGTSPHQRVPRSGATYGTGIVAVSPV